MHKKPDILNVFECTGEKIVPDEEIAKPRGKESRRMNECQLTQFSDKEGRKEKGGLMFFFPVIDLLLGLLEVNNFRPCFFRNFFHEQKCLERHPRTEAKQQIS